MAVAIALPIPELAPVITAFSLLVIVTFDIFERKWLSRRPLELGGKRFVLGMYILFHGVVLTQFEFGQAQVAAAFCSAVGPERQP